MYYYDYFYPINSDIGEAWWEVFGTTQLTHARDRLDVAE
jgi:hypothetical protein